MLRRLTVFTVAAFSALALAACTPSGPDPTSTQPPTSTPSSSSSSSTSQTSTAPSTSTSSTSSTGNEDPPEAARTNSPDGAKAFALFVGTSLDKAFAELNSDVIANFSQPGCKSCTGAQNAIAGYKARSEKFVGQYANFTSPTYSGETGGITRVVVHSAPNGAKVLDRNGATIKTIQPSSGNLSVQMQFDGKWRVAEIQGVG